MSCQKEKKSHRKWLSGPLLFPLLFNCRKEGRPIPIIKVALIFCFYQLVSGCQFVYLIELLTHQDLLLRKYAQHVLYELNILLNIKKYS